MCNSRLILEFEKVEESQYVDSNSSTFHLEMPFKMSNFLFLVMDLKLLLSSRLNSVPHVLSVLPNEVSHKVITQGTPLGWNKCFSLFEFVCWLVLYLKVR